MPIKIEEGTRHTIDMQLNPDLTVLIVCPFRLNSEQITELILVLKNYAYFLHRETE